MWNKYGHCTPPPRIMLSGMPRDLVIKLAIVVYYREAANDKKWFMQFLAKAIDEILLMENIILCSSTITSINCA